MTSDNHLLRDKAPIPVRAWKEIDAEAKERLTPLLAARRLTDWVGEGGWIHDAMSLGRTTRLDDLPKGMELAPDAGVVGRLRRVLPLAELRVPFTVAREEIDDIQRGSRDAELDDLARAAQVAAELENRAVFSGWDAAGIEGIAAASPYDPVPLGAEPGDYPLAVARAIGVLRTQGIEGPFALVVGPETYTAILETSEEGDLLLDHLVSILGGDEGAGEVIRASGVDVGLVVTQRGGDFLLDVGQDLSIGYSHHDAEQVHLFLEESFTFLVAEPDAAVRLV